MAKKNKWSRVSVLTALLGETENLIKSNPQLGYPNTSSFVNDAVRRLLQNYHGFLRGMTLSTLGERSEEIIEREVEAELFTPKGKDFVNSPQLDACVEITENHRVVLLDKCERQIAVIVVQKGIENGLRRIQEVLEKNGFKIKVESEHQPSEC